MKQTGQTLVELIISITLIVIIITAVTTLTVNGLKNSQFSRNQVQATKLAQEGIEKMRTIRDNSFTICGPPVNTIVSTGLWGASCPGPGGCQYLIKSTAGSCASTGTTTLWLNFTSLSTDNEPIIVDGVTFKRIITVVDGKDLDNTASANIKEITATVSWIDSSGTHNSKVSTILTKL